MDRCKECGNLAGLSHHENCKYGVNPLQHLDYIKFGGPCLFCGAPSGWKHKDGCQELHRSKPVTEESTTVEEKTALSTQVGGDHYKNFVIQPIEFITKNKLSFVQGCVIKRICRYNLPGGKGNEDLEKIIHEIKCLIELE